MKEKEFMDIKENIRQFFIKELKELNTDENVPYIDDNTPLIESGILDSMMTLSLLAFLEEYYGILLSQEELNPKSFGTIQKIHDLIIQKKKNC